MLQLNTVFPYVKDVYNIVMDSQNAKAIYSIFNKIPSRRTKQGQKTNTNNASFIPIRCENEFNSSEFTDELVRTIGQSRSRKKMNNCTSHRMY